MTWKLQGKESAGRWAEMTSDGFTADATTLDGVRAQQGDTLLLTPTGPGYASTGDRDEVWLWLAATEAIGGAYELVAGVAPKLPIPAPATGVTY